LARCRVGVVASVGSEAVSRAALEWMAAGRPVVASRVGCLPDLVIEGETGFLVPPANPRALAQALARFLQEPGLAERMGAAGRRRFDEKFSLGRFADETESLYAQVLDNL
jgi:glycosyltransferase involved in cell wall biosynthesis